MEVSQENQYSKNAFSSGGWGNSGNFPKIALFLGGGQKGGPKGILRQLSQLHRG
jgi:hypothetical protein